MTASQHIRFALRAAKRDFVAGELRVLALALLIAVASVTAVGFFTDRIGRAMERQAADVLAADVIATSGFPIPADVITEAERNNLRIATHSRFPSVVINDQDESQLVAVKAVSPEYPLRGSLRIEKLDNPGVAAPLDSPAPGTVWVDVQLKNVLALRQTDTITLGAKNFVVDRLITYEPDRGQNVFELAPRVMLAESDLAGAGLLGEGSRARYTVLMASDSASDLANMRTWLSNNKQDEVRVQGVRDTGPQMQRALNRAQRFLGLASVVTVLLAGAAIALAVRHFSLNQADASAVLRTLGASRRAVIIWLVLRLCAVATVASLLGIVVGWFAQMILARLLVSWFSLELPAPGILAPIVGVLTAFITLAGFGLLPVLKAGRVSVVRVLQRDYSGLQTSSTLTLLVGLSATFGIVWLLSKDMLLSGIVVLGVVSMLLVFAVFGRLIISLIRRIAGRRYRLSVAGLQRRAGSSVVQLAAFGMGIMALLLIAIVRVDILSAWERDLPDDAPNVFVLNIQADQVPGFSDRLAAQNIEHTGIYPMVRARLVARNGEPVYSDPDDERQARRARREYNLSFSDTLPVNNEIVEGQWWTTDGSASAQLSVEQEWAEDRGFSIGDELTFRAAGVETSAVITNFRKVDWESFQVNFFFVATPAMLEGFPSTYVTSFHVKEDFSSATAGWAREFPGIAAIDVGAIITRVKTLMDRASLAVEYVFLFTLLAGACVLLAAVQSSQSERIKESALLRALGASHQQIRSSVIAEFSILGAIAGALAALFATVIAWALTRFVFELPFSINGWLWFLGVFGGGIGIAITGYLATRKVLHTPPVVALRHNG
ncbi:MAG: FtsX-like permease family protein [Gammaproteobacteria bacterium]|nr:FtsX-like permease family protein [Gammaproteobacteria bacterium]